MGPQKFLLFLLQLCNKCKASINSVNQSKILKGTPVKSLHPVCVCVCPQTNLPIFKLKESCVRRRYSDFEWLRAELERESKVSRWGELNTKVPEYLAYQISRWHWPHLRCFHTRVKVVQRSFEHLQFVEIELKLKVSWLKLSKSKPFQITSTVILCPYFLWIFTSKCGHVFIPVNQNLKFSYIS